MMPPDRLMGQRLVKESAHDGPLYLALYSTLNVSASTVVVNSAILTYSYTLTQLANKEPLSLTMPRFDIFIGGTNPAVNLWPNGSGITRSQYKVYPPLNVSYHRDGTAALASESIWRTAIQNNSGSTQTITVMTRYIQVANQGNNAGGS
jgi:hypothetical protein